MANTKVTGDVIANGTISTVHLVDDAITAAKLDSTATGITFADLTVDTDTLYVDAANNRVGIGTTTNISSPLTVQTDGSASSISIIGRDNGTSDEAIISFYEYDGTTRNSYIIKDGGDLAIATGTGGSPLERMRITSTGNVGIGTTSPSQKLEVIGNVSLGLSSTTTRTALLANTFGYSTAWKTLTIGGTGTNYQTDAVSLCFNVMLNQNSSGVYTGDGSEYFWRNTGSFMTPNSGNNGYNTILSWNSSGQPNFPNNVGIGNTNPLAKLQITSGDSGASSPWSNADELVLESSGNAGLAFQTPNTGAATIAFQDPESVQAGFIQYLHGDNLMRFATNGNNIRAVIDSSGQVGIGTTSPSSKLDVVGSNSSSNPLVELTASGTGEWQRGVRLLNGGMTAGDSIMYGIGYADNSRNMGQTYFYYAGSGSTSNRISMGLHSVDDVFNILGSGNVGIGTTSPQALLHVHDPDTTYTNYGTVFLGTTAGGSTGESGISLMTSGDALAGFVGSNLTIDGTTYSQTNASRSSGYINFVNTTVAGKTSYIIFGGTVKGSTTLTERMRINDNGNVGIGTTSPSSTLTIGNATDNVAELRVLRSNASSSTYAYVDTVGGTAQFGGTGDVRLKADGASILRFNTNSAERMRITSGGDVEITGGYSSSQSFQSTGSLRVSSNSTATNGNVALELMNDATGTRYLATFTNLNGIVGSISTYASSTSYNTSSDYRLKENVIEMTGALDRVSQLKPSRFNFIADADKTVDGFLAHEVQEIVPEAITGEKDAVDEEGNPEYQGIDQSKLVPLLVGAIQELKAEIELLKTQINN